LKWIHITEGDRMRRFVVVLALLVALLSISMIATQAQNQQTHTVQAGETLYRISLRYGVTLTALVQANSIANPNLIFVGQVLIIPTGGTTPPPATPVPGGNPPPATGQTYVVQRGDTLGSIARRFGTTYQAMPPPTALRTPT
jgi:LysM repeat protein